ncbi:MAG: zinc finger Ran-binding domain-containing protein [Planctomycetota bacterium]|jgi:hypothetical protein|nr:zinc finger Ran-binding domain-containing protein [Planctomycetota bacterium]
MSSNKDDTFDPGFVDDDEAKAKESGAKQDFDPFADVGPINTGGIAGVADGDAGAPGGGLAAAGPASAASPSIAPTPTDADDDVDPDVVPGSRKDLWLCPHCTAKNRPGRDTCRSCGKSPDDPVESALKKKVPLIAGLGVVVLLAILAFVFGGTDTGFHPVGRDHVDTDIRASGDLVAASGRVLSVHASDHGPVALMLVFGGPAASDQLFSELRAEVDSQVAVKRGDSIANDVEYALVHVLSDTELPAVSAGQFVSFTGVEVTKPALKRDEWVVKVDQIEVTE